MTKPSDHRMESSVTTDSDSTIVPEDLLIEILKRLPVRSLCRFSCVSSRWRSLIAEPHFIDSQLTHSLTRPKLVVSFPYLNADRRGGLWLFSADQPEPRNDRPHIARPQLFLRGWAGAYVSQSHDGLFCLEVGSKVKICNTSTGKHVTFRSPRITASSAPCSYFQQTHSFGFDPVERKHKVLSIRAMSKGRPNRELIMEPWVLTLGTNRWRRVEGCAPHYKKDREFCSDGVVYYTAWNFSHGFRRDNCLVAFEVRTESFRMIMIPVGAHEVRYKALLIKFEGRIALVDHCSALYGREIVMWILEDPNREIWNRRVFVLPPCWHEIVPRGQVSPVGIVRSGELLFAPRTSSKPVCLFYYNLKTSSCWRSEICGLPEDELPTLSGYGVLNFSDHVESLLPPRGLSGGN